MKPETIRAVQALNREIAEAHLTALDRSRIAEASQAVIAAMAGEITPPAGEPRGEEDPPP